MGAMFPFVSSAPAPSAAYFPESETGSDIANRVWLSFHNRLGRPPTEREMSDAIPHFMSAGAPMTADQPSGAVSSFAMQQYGEGYGSSYLEAADSTGGTRQPFNSDEGRGEQIATAASLRNVAIIEPRESKEVRVELGGGEYHAWVRVTNLGSWTGWLSPPGTRSPLMDGPPYQLDVHLNGGIATVDRMHEQSILLRISNNSPVGVPNVQPINGGAPLRGPGHIWLEAANGGPHPVEVVFGAN